MKILVVGGTGEFGSYYARFFRQKGYDVSISGRDIEKAKKAAANLWVKAAETKIGAGEADIIAICVPVGNVPKAIAECAKSAGKGALIVDFCSVKRDACRALQKFRRKELELASMHPMHSPRVANLKGIRVISIPIKTAGKYELLKKIFENEGAIITECSAREHDEMLSIVQGLTHFLHMVAGATLNDLRTDIGRSRKFSSPVYEVMLSTIARIALQNPELYASIQLENPLNRRVRDAFCKNAQKLCKLAKTGNKGKFEMEIAKIGKIFGKNTQFLFESDKVVEAVRKELASPK